MITISVCLIVKNEEDVLERCLTCAEKIADEIIVADTGSTDKTKEIAKKFTDKVYDFKWVDDFSKARNFAFSKATMDYQMWLDADDVINDSEIEKILKLKEELTEEYDMVTMKYDVGFDKNGVCTLSSTRERLLKRKNNYLWQDPIHECIPLRGKIYYSDIRITHKKMKASEPKRNIKIYEALEKKNAKFTPRQLYYFARELKDNGIYKKSIVYFNKFLDTKKGWVEDNIASCYNLGICHKLLGQTDKILPNLLRSFEYAPPRAEICVEIGYYYKNLQDFEKAKEWFLIAHKMDKREGLGFILNDCWTYLPCIELCYCYFKLGDLKKSEYFNELAAEYKPNSVAVQHNNQFFGTLEEKK